MQQLAAVGSHHHHHSSAGGPAHPHPHRLQQIVQHATGVSGIVGLGRSTAHHFQRLTDHHFDGGGFPMDMHHHQTTTTTTRSAAAGTAAPSSSSAAASLAASLAAAKATRTSPTGESSRSNKCRVNSSLLSHPSYALFLPPVGRRRYDGARRKLKSVTRRRARTRTTRRTSRLTFLSLLVPGNGARSDGL